MKKAYGSIPFRYWQAMTVRHNYGFTGRFSMRTEDIKEELLKIEEARKLPRAKTLTIEELMNYTFPVKEKILDPWLDTQGLAMAHAWRGVGKTHFSLGVGYAVVSAGVFLRWQAHNPRGVLFVDGEMPGAVIQERLARLIKSSEKEPMAAFKIITPDIQPYGMPDIATDEGQQMIEDHLDGISLIILDNLSTLVRSGRENEGDSWLPVQEWILRLRARGLSCLFIHHDGKGGIQRGTTRKEDVLDTVIGLKRPGDYRPDEGARFEVHFEKSRGVHGDAVKPFEASLITHDNYQEWHMKDLEQSLSERVAALFKEGVPQNEIHEMLGVTRGAVAKAKKRAGNQGLLSDGK